MNKRNLLVGIAAALFLVVVVVSVLITAWPAGFMHPTNNTLFSQTIFNDYGLIILVVGLTLFVSMLGGVYIAQEEKE
jgi:NADH:ubiquinone oxidoreductase subunit 6 (subunit J)